MSGKKLFKALRQIDTQLILDAAPGEWKKTHANKGWVKWGALAACLCLVVSVVIGAVLWLRYDEPVPPEPTLPHEHTFG